MVEKIRKYKEKVQSNVNAVRFARLFSAVCRLDEIRLSEQIGPSFTSVDLGSHLVRFACATSADDSNWATWRFEFYESNQPEKINSTTHVGYSFTDDGLLMYVDSDNSRRPLDESYLLTNVEQPTNPAVRKELQRCTDIIKFAAKVVL